MGAAMTVNRLSTCVGLVVTGLLLSGCATRDFCRVVPFPLRDGAGVAVEVRPFWTQAKADPIGATAAVGQDLLVTGGTAGLAWLLYSIADHMGDSTVDSHDVYYNAGGDMTINGGGEKDWVTP
jgi:hypothetical protein